VGVLLPAILPGVMAFPTYLCGISVGNTFLCHSGRGHLANERRKILPTA